MSIKNVGNVHIDTTVLDRLTIELQPKAEKIVKQYGNMITVTAVTLAPVDTGNLINTITANSKMIAPLTFRVQDGTEYGIFQELGTYKMAAHPFMVPALEKWRQKFLDAFGDFFK